MTELTLEQVREAFYAEFRSVPFHQRLGIRLDRGDDGEARMTLPARPELEGEPGEHSPAAVYTLADAAASIQVCEEAAKRALELGMGAIFFTVSGRFREHGPARGTIEGRAELVEGLAEATGESGASRKASVDVLARISDEAGSPVAEHRTTFYVRFMELSRMRDMYRPTSEFVRLLGS